MTIKVKFYDGVKYNEESKKIDEVFYKNVTNLEVKKISDEEILKTYDMVDEFQEYATLTFADGGTATFRNSHIDMFRE